MYCKCIDERRHVSSYLPKTIDAIKIGSGSELTDVGYAKAPAYLR